MDWRDSPYLKYVNPEQQQGLAGDMLDTGLSILDAPAGMTRNLLSGRDLLAGLFDSSKRATGQDVLKAMGSDDPSEFSGMLVDILADPLWLTGVGRKGIGGGFKALKSLLR